MNGELTAPQRLRRFRSVAIARVSPCSPARDADGSSFSKADDYSSLASTPAASSSVGSDHCHRRDNSPSTSRTTSRLLRGGGRGNPVLEGEAQRLEALKRRRFMELQQMLAFQLRSLAREVKRAARYAQPSRCVCKQPQFRCVCHVHLILNSEENRRSCVVSCSGIVGVLRCFCTAGVTAVGFTLKISLKPAF